MSATEGMDDMMGARSRMRRGRGASVVVGIVLTLSGVACDSETRIDPEVERNVPPGLRQEGSPRDEEN